MNERVIELVVVIKLVVVILDEQRMKEMGSLFIHITYSSMDLVARCCFNTL
jgi:hypothetical protein